MNQAHKLKALETKLGEAEVNLAASRVKFSEAQKICQQHDSTVKSLRSQIKALKDESADPILSEHAMLRFIERAHGIDLELLTSEIMTDELVRLLKFTRTGRVTHEGMVYVVRNGTVVTVENVK